MTSTTPNITHRKVHVKFNFERFAYMFMRMSGLDLAHLGRGPHDDSARAKQQRQPHTCVCC